LFSESTYLESFQPGENLSALTGEVKFEDSSLDSAVVVIIREVRIPVTISADSTNATPPCLFMGICFNPIPFE
jgi:hypothetical protein